MEPDEPQGGGAAGVRGCGGGWTRHTGTRQRISRSGLSEIYRGRHSGPHRGDQATRRAKARTGYSPRRHPRLVRSEEHTSELQSLMRISYAVFCLKKKKKNQTHTYKAT